MTLSTIVLKNLGQRPTRSLLTIAGIAIAIGAVVALTSLAWGFENAWVRVYTARGTDLIVAKAGSLSPVPPAFSRDQVRDLQAVAGVAALSGMLTDVVSIEDAPIVLLFGWESNSFVWNHLRLVSGRWPTDDAEPSVVLGTVAVEVMNKPLGSHVRIEATTFTVCGVFESASLAENGAVVMTLPQLQRLTDQAGKVNFVNVKVAPDTTADELGEMRRAIAARFPGFRAFTSSQVANQNAAILAVKAMSWATSVIALVVGAVGVMNTALMSVFERIHEIGILLAVGWRRRRIVLMIVYESMALSLAGGVAGIGLGAAAVVLLQRTPLLRGKIEGEFSPRLFGLALAIALGLGVLGGLYPAYRGSRMRPSDALRHE
jgi:putative ABC transport system permease protein